MLLSSLLSCVISAKFEAVAYGFHIMACSDQFIPEICVKDLRLSGLHREGSSDQLVMSALVAGRDSGGSADSHYIKASGSRKSSDAMRFRKCCLWDNNLKWPFFI